MLLFQQVQQVLAFYQKNNIRRFGPFIGFKILNFNILGFGGMKKLLFLSCVCVWGGGGLSQNRTSFLRGVGGSFLCILRVFLRSRYRIGTFLEVA